MIQSIRVNDNVHKLLLLHVSDKGSFDNYYRISLVAAQFFTEVLILIIRESLKTKPTLSLDRNIANQINYLDFRILFHSFLTNSFL